MPTQATSRRAFLALVAASPLFASASTMKGARPRRLLILGGTAFLGPHLVDAARRRGFAVTLFNRGKTNPGLPAKWPGVETLIGDRDGNLKALVGRRWDAVIDTSGYVPRLVRDSAMLLSDKVQQYVFISSISVYKDTRQPGMDETAPVGRLADESVESIGDGAYGPLKALCEQAAEKAMPGRVTVIRPGLIVGPRDQSDRFTYWPARLERGGEVLAPGTPLDPVQFIDVRDLAKWTILTLEAGHLGVGVFNATGPKDPLTVGELLEACRAASQNDARLTWVSAKFLEEHKVSSWSDMPVWVPPTGDSAGFARLSIARALARGLTFRPLAETVKDTLDAFHALPAERREKLHAGIKSEREVEVLAAWHAQAKKATPPPMTGKQKARQG